MKLLLTLCGAAAMLMSAVAAPKPQNTMNQHDLYGVMFAGLFSADRGVANAHWMSLSGSERDVLMKRVSLCMNDPHKDMMTMAHTNANVMAHMLNGLDANEQRTMIGILSKMTTAQESVGMKIMMNVCTYGMTHAK